MKPAQITALKDKMYVQLWKEVDNCLVVPQGFRFLIPDTVTLQDERELPARKIMLWSKKPKHSLRYYQREAIDALRKDTRGQAVMATGTGKSFTMLHLVREMGLKTLIICPSSIIGGQLYDEFVEALGKKHVGMYGSGKKEIKQVTVGLYQSVTRNMELFRDTELVICDENQTLGAGSLMSITRELAHAPYFYSLSATNYRADGRTPEIYAASGPVAYDFDTVRAIKEGFLAQPHFYVRKVDSYGKEYDLKQANYKEHVVLNEKLNDQIVSDAQKMLNNGMSTLILVQEIEHGEHISERLGLQFANGENKGSMKLIQALNKKEIRGLVAGAQMCSIGVNTVRVDCLINAAFQGSEGIVTQSLGRGLRKYEGKTRVIVLDYIPQGNSMLKRHGDFRCTVYEKYGPVKKLAASAVK
jgi:DNA repair protein RadD